MFLKYTLIKICVVLIYSPMLKRQTLIEGQKSLLSNQYILKVVIFFFINRTTFFFENFPIIFFGSEFSYIIT